MTDHWLLKCQCSFQDSDFKLSGFRKIFRLEHNVSIIKKSWFLISDIWFLECLSLHNVKEQPQAAPVISYQNLSLILKHISPIQRISSDHWSLKTAFGNLPLRQDAAAKRSFAVICRSVISNQKACLCPRESGEHGDSLEWVFRGSNSRPIWSLITKNYSAKCYWWRWTGSNRWPPACKAGALPAELHPRSSRSELVLQNISVTILQKFLSRTYKCSNLLFCNTATLASDSWLALRAWWAREDLNLRPHAYQARALTNWATSPL